MVPVQAGESLAGNDSRLASSTGSSGGAGRPCGLLPIVSLASCVCLRDIAVRRLGPERREEGGRAERGARARAEITAPAQAGFGFAGMSLQDDRYGKRAARHEVLPEHENSSDGKTCGSRAKSCRSASSVAVIRSLRPTWLDALDLGVRTRHAGLS